MLIIFEPFEQADLALCLLVNPLRRGRLPCWRGLCLCWLRRWSTRDVPPAAARALWQGPPPHHLAIRVTRAIRQGQTGRVEARDKLCWRSLASSCVTSAVVGRAWGQPKAVEVTGCCCCYPLSPSSFSPGSEASCGLCGEIPRPSAAEWLSESASTARRR